MSLARILGFGPEETPDAAAGARAGTIRAIVDALEKMDPARAKHLAAFAFILSRVANADRHISAPERAQMEHSVRTWGHLPEDQTVLVVEIAINQNILFGGTDNFIVTRQFREHATPEQKEDLLHCLFAVSAAEDAISGVEEAVVAQIAQELGLSHRDMVGIRAAWRDKRKVLKDLPKS